MTKKKSRKPVNTLQVEPFWQTKTLSEMSRDEWESLCDGCAKCCLHTFIDDDKADSEVTLLPTDHIQQGESLYYSNIACYLLNETTCQCTKYEQRTKLVPDCVRLTQDNIEGVFFMPPSCTYRRIQEGRGLPSWHPLLHKGKKSAMHKAGMSVRGKIVKDDEVSLDKFEDHIVTWAINDLD
ncbi:YcgN family cysteine cluster protein [Litorilituus lipolyticus]|uniref:YcgN family cysteine cluster protein n=1 Tax=Litorilituus lipolyticus TaxID=2491017 RepID=A0A502KLU7_9GAMM|nr:YcgN family cysteine cluster protein [Litorilituus lipolyticus]TPH12572.1 YcgN family cysteine cluster protein [Litorilituus lipolyticus]